MGLPPPILVLELLPSELPTCQLVRHEHTLVLDIQRVRRVVVDPSSGEEITVGHLNDACVAIFISVIPFRVDDDDTESEKDRKCQRDGNESDKVPS